MILQYERGGPVRAAGAVTAAGAKVTRALPAIAGAAITADKDTTGTLWTSLTVNRDSARADTTAGVDKIWLDGKRKLTLDKSVPQIGAPAAWQAGFTGKGVTVAVLDSGVDATHKDLTGAVQTTFVDGPNVDEDGHGTHVSSTIAGTGAASGGKYKGVAPDATLRVGKVCGPEDCPESAVLAGMQWAAVDQKARVVNISLGGPDTPELDPMEQALNTLTAQTGALFVVAAGNEGDGASTVGSPGSADAALTVGAVDSADALADFSSRGPRVGDAVIKPDVTAPGVGIVAAMATGTAGVPVDGVYTAMDGTSMATPHVAGAAALLAQQHPDWKAAQLKAALMASAKPQDALSVFEQGAGRVDLARGITQSLLSDPPSVSFGLLKWPNTDTKPTTKTVTYRNTGAAAVQLNLSVQTTAAEKVYTVTPAKLTVPAGGTATAELTADTGKAAAGAYSARLVAVGGSQTVITPVGSRRK